MLCAPETSPLLAGRPEEVPLVTAWFDSCDDLGRWQPQHLVPMLPFVSGAGDPSRAPVNQQAAWSPDGTRLAMTGGPRPAVVDVRTGAVTPLLPDGVEVRRQSPIFWSPDGKRVALLVVVDGQPVIAIASADGAGAYQLARGSGVTNLLGFDDQGMLILGAGVGV